jgi:hypothetical protein
MNEGTPSTLCEACHAIFQQNITAFTSEAREITHHGLETLAEKASDCHLCLTVFMSIDPEAYRTFNQGSNIDSVGFAWLSPIARDQARLKFRFTKPLSAPLGEDGRPITPNSDISRSTLMVDWEDTAGLVVELILMHPKCEYVVPGEEGG